MIAPADDRRSAPPVAITLVWIDSREAIVVRGSDPDVRFAHIPSGIPAHHRATGHVRHDPCVRHGGAGPHTGGQSNRQEHMTRFLATVAHQLPLDEDLLLIGPGTVHEHLARLVRKQGTEHRNDRRILSEHAPRMSRAQLATRLLRATGDEPRRHSVGAYRWTTAGPLPPPLQGGVSPRRVVDKGSRRADDEDEDEEPMDG